MILYGARVTVPHRALTAHGEWPRFKSLDATPTWSRARNNLIGGGGRLHRNHLAAWRPELLENCLSLSCIILQQHSDDVSHSSNKTLATASSSGYLVTNLRSHPPMVQRQMNIMMYTLGWCSVRFVDGIKRKRGRRRIE